MLRYMLKYFEYILVHNLPFYVYVLLVILADRIHACSVLIHINYFAYFNCSVRVYCDTLGQMQVLRVQLTMFPP